MGIVSVTVQIGYKSHTVELTGAEWRAILIGPSVW